jgi:hypothetical protein
MKNHLTIRLNSQDQPIGNRKTSISIVQQWKEANTITVALYLSKEDYKPPPYHIYSLRLEI